MTVATSTEPEDHFALVTCMEARPGDGHAVIGENAPFDSWARARVSATLAVRLYREILEASRMGWWQFWYRVETTETEERHPTGDGDKTLNVHEWKIFTNRNDMPIYRVVLWLGREPMKLDVSVDPTSDLQTVFRRISAANSLSPDTV
jgi:hypothetical protein